MDIFKTHRNVVSDYSTYIQSFLRISDPAIKAKVEEELSKGKLWPEPLLQFNPSFEKISSIKELIDQGLFHQDIEDIFSGYSLYRHQVEAIKLGTAGSDFIVTSGTGSGKSLTYIGSIFHHLLSNPGSEGVVAVVVYPMNALINSQFEEFDRYKANYEKVSGREFPISFGQYTGQEKEPVRQKMRETPPQILLTNYMMLELLLTRTRERSIRDGIFKNLRFLVFDELHTYRGRQGADVAMLMRRILSQCEKKTSCIGTSATMVSIGSLADQKNKVAEVATKLFGRPFKSNQIINETLTRSLQFNIKIPEKKVLADAINAGIDASWGGDILLKHPVAVWMENCVALEENDGVLSRRNPKRFSEIVHELEDVSGISSEICRPFLENLIQWISSINKQLQESGKRYTILPFKLHQFISQTGSVYTTLDQNENRFITLEPGIYKEDDVNKKPIFPNVFSRSSGHTFICVSRVGDLLVPREFKESDDETPGAVSGYLIVGDDLWDPVEDMEMLPDTWLRFTKSGKVPRAEKKLGFPVPIFFDEFGNCSEIKSLKWSGWFMKAPLLFDPTSGQFFDTKTNENTKLAKLGSEGRSTSTTITAVSILNQLADSGFKPEDQKVLSFTDNRQDAALQAGHFNDFVQVVRLRTGIRKALDNSSVGLNYATIGEAVFKALSLPFTEYANKNEAPQLATIRRKYEECLQHYLLYRSVHDLRRSWRVILPNLEQTALLKIEYTDLVEIAAENEYWGSLPILGDLPHSERIDFLTTILDFFRLEYAIHSENYLTQSKIKEFQKHFIELLRNPWTLDRNEELPEPFFIRLDPLNKTSGIFSKSMGPTSGLGKFIKLYVKQNQLNVDLQGENYRHFVLQLMKKLEDADFLISRTARNEKNEEVPIYRIRLEKIIWKKGDGKTVKTDVIKQRSYKSVIHSPNLFFQNLYMRDFSALKRLRGEDHTGQLQTDTRIQREDLFRKGEISALFCSPTMELGIDISNLSVVHLRNAPPNPANYAQRAGRAGRSGQGALIFTYCSSYSPHDRHYFAHQESLVSGSVIAPKLDLCNRELLASHLNALVASAIGLPGLEEDAGAKPSIMRLVIDDGDKLQLPLSPAAKAGLTIPPQMFSGLKASFTRIIRDFEGDLKNGTNGWYSDVWVENNLTHLTENLDAALKRWRILYRSARNILTRATQKLESGTLTLGSDEYRKHKRNLDQATRQLDLLRNQLDGRSTELSEFYPYRYLASEGFLPGYNFTRLPLRVFLPTTDSSGEFISRSRAIAMREFGPQNIIYHNGRKYRVCQLVVQDAESNLTEAKISKKAGYFLPADQKDLEICPFTGLNLGDNANVEHVHDLIEMAESRGEEIDRISCEEEERVSKGFEIKTYLSVDGGNFDRIQKAVARTGENSFLNLRYIPVARLVHVNSHWRSDGDKKGFPMGLVSGDWRKGMPESDDVNAELCRYVRLWTSNVSDALYIEPIQPLGLRADGVITLQHALKRAIESTFQVESNEIGVVTLGNPEAPNILIYEASEGSLGILSQFVQNVATFRRVVEKAIELCRYNDPSYKAPASYDDLLSYYNQRDHKIVDRHLIKDALEKLLVCEIEIQSSRSYKNYEDHYQALLRGLDPNSTTERKFIDYLYDKGLRLPDAAQKRVEGVYVQPDFYYEPRFWIFCDGTPHDQPDVKEADAIKRQAIIAQGDEVWVYYYKDDLARKVASRSDIFKKVK